MGGLLGLEPRAATLCGGRANWTPNPRMRGFRKRTGPTRLPILYVPLTALAGGRLFAGVHVPNRTVSSTGPPPSRTADALKTVV